MRVAGREIKEGEVITLDGTTGEVMLGEVPTVQPELVGDFGTLMQCADAHRRLRVRTNAETVNDRRTAREFGAEGIGLCRTEHMFFDLERITDVRQMILAENEAGRRAALDRLLPAQRSTSSRSSGRGRPAGDDPAARSAAARIPAARRGGVRRGRPRLRPRRRDAARRANELAEANPMLGHRGCRLGITYPEIYEMQARAIFEAAVAVARDGEALLLEVMVPLVATRAELRIIRELIERTAEQVFEEQGQRVDYLVGTMIELPRAALAAASIAEEASFFSFGTNDLTQTALGVSRDDAGRFLASYVEKGELRARPVRQPRHRGRRRADHDRGRAGRRTPRAQARHLRRAWRRSGLDRLREAAGLDYVSASPYRVPIARLAAAQAALRKRR